MLHDILVAQPQCNVVHSIDSSNGEFIDDRTVSGVVNRKIASHYGTKKLFHDILLWQSPGNLRLDFRRSLVSGPFPNSGW